MKKHLWSLLLLAFVTMTMAQIPQNTFSDLQYNGQGRLFYARLESSVNIGEAATPALIGQVLGSPYQLVAVRSDRDEFGLTHVRYDIHRDGKPIAGRRVLAHFSNGRLVSVNGDLQMARTAEDVSFTLSEQEALSAALAKVNAASYKWNNKEEEEHMRQALNDPSFTYYPHGKQVWFERKGTIHAAWQFNIYANEPLYRANVFVDAATGEILDEQNLICTVNTPGSAATKYSGTQTITCDQMTSGVHRLRQTTSGQGVETYNMKNGNNYAAASDFTNATSSWTSTGFDQGAHDAHWGAEKTYDYYKAIHNRNSINNMGMKLLSYVHYNTGYSNAFWDGQRMTYGDGNGSSTTMFAALDVCGHEITHGLTDWTANLVYSYESGALNESWSDIFGTAIENHARPGNWNWKIGEDLTSSGFGLRSMQTPNSYGDPDTYKGSYWYSGSGDNGGVHTNSGVPNHWFYLLTVGGTGTNDLGDAYNIQGLGIYNAGLIAYRALAFYFTPNTDFVSARIGCMEAAKDIFGDCSNEMIQTANAWYAVGVGKKVSPTAVQPDFKSRVFSFCSLPATVSFSNTTPYGYNYKWSFGDGGSSLAVDPVHTYTAAGNYNVQLRADGCGGTDSILKSAYIMIDLPASPSVAGATVCEGSPAALYATANGLLNWYSTPSSTTSLQSGTVISIPSLTSTVTYYIDNTYTASPVSGGKPTIGGGGYLNNMTHYLEFEVHQNCTLNSVILLPSGSGLRTIELRNGANFVLDSKMVNLASGTNTVTLDFPLTPGIGYRLGFANTTGPNVYRSNSGVSYPYTIGDCVTITGSSAGTGNYYWFYNWTVTRASCVSPQSAVTASVLPLPVVNVSSPSPGNSFCVGDLIQLDVSPAGGWLSGNGAQGTSSFNALTAGAGTHTLTYAYTDENGCTAAHAIELTAEECTGLAEQGLSPVALFPNPARGSVTIAGLVKGAVVSVFDNAGRLVHSLQADSDVIALDIAGQAKGLYLVTVRAGNSRSDSLRLIIE